MRQAPPPLLRRSFDARRLRPPRPGCTSRRSGSTGSRSTAGRSPTTCWRPAGPPYRHRLLADTYDVTALLRQGANVIGAAIGDGWYRGRLGCKPGGDRATYGPEVGADRPARGRASPTARRRSSRPTTRGARPPARSDRPTCTTGASIDLRERQAGWDAPGVRRPRAGRRPERSRSSRRAIEPRLAPPVRVVGVLPVDADASAAPGRTRARRRPERRGLRPARPSAGRGRDRRHGAARRGPRAGRVAPPPRAAERQGDRHVRASPTTPRPCSSRAFTFHGFRYAEVETDAELLDAEIVAISSDTPQRGDVRLLATRALNRLHENVRLVAARQLRLGAHRLPAARRAARLDRRRPGVRADRLARCSTPRRSGASWLRDLALEQDPVLGVPSVVPNVVLDGPLRFGRAGWADAATIVPWAVLRGVRRPGGRRGPVGEHARAGSSRCVARRGRRRPARASSAVRRLARPRRAAGPAVGGQGRLGLPRQRVLRRTAPGSRPTAARLLGDEAIGGPLRRARATRSPT